MIFELGREYWFLDKDNKIQDYIVIVVSFNQNKEVVINGYSPSMREELKSKLERKYPVTGHWYKGRTMSYKNETVIVHDRDSSLEELLNKHSIEKSYTFTLKPDQLYSSIEDLQNIQLVKKQEQYDRDLEKLQSQYNNDLDELFKP